MFLGIKTIKIAHRITQSDSHSNNVCFSLIILFWNFICSLILLSCKRPYTKQEEQSKYANVSVDLSEMSTICMFIQIESKTASRLKANRSERIWESQQ